MIAAMEYLLAATKEGGWGEDTQILLLCRFIDGRELGPEFAKFLQDQLDEEANMTPGLGSE